MYSKVPSGLFMKTCPCQYYSPYKNPVFTRNKPFESGQVRPKPYI